jgi:hypothetical protein
MGTGTARLGRDQAELNREFLELLAQGPDAGLSATVLTRVRGLDADARGRLAALPFALFGFGFEDETAWARLLSPGVRDLDPGYVSRDPLVERFTLLALTALRGFAGVAPHKTGAWIGLPVETRARLAEVEIGTLSAAAVLAAPRLRSRLAHREQLWLRLIDASERNDRRQLVVLAALGKQWTIRRCLKLKAPGKPVRAFRR